MFTSLAIIFTILACIMVPHGGNRHTIISNIGCLFGIAALVLWVVLAVGAFWHLIAWLWENAW